LLSPPPTPSGVRITYRAIRLMWHQVYFRIVRQESRTKARKPKTGCDPDGSDGSSELQPTGDMTATRRTGIVLLHISTENQNSMRRTNIFLLPIVVVMSTASSYTAEALPPLSAEQVLAREIVDVTGVKGGLVVHLGCGEGKLTAALRAGDRYIVQGLEGDAATMGRARRHIQSLGLYGPVSVDRLRGTRLPYIDNLVNLVVAEDLGSVAMDEVLRVLCPNGVAYVKKGAKWTKHVKPWPNEIDQWPHYLHGPDNNAVANDSVVGPPKHVQWICGPTYARSHETSSSMAAMVSAGGRLFYIWDEGIIGLVDKRMPPRWSLLARDAFNGALLWKKPMPNWGWRQWHAESRWKNPRDYARMLRELPATTPRRLVATKKEVYVTLGYEAPVSVLSAATGEVLEELKGTALTDEILHADGTLVLRVRVPDSRPEKNVGTFMSNRSRGRVMAVDAESRRMIWQSEPEEMAPLTLATRNGRVYYSNYERVVCLDLASGRELWRSEPIQGKLGDRATCGTLVAQDKVVLYARVVGGPAWHSTARLRALSAKTGELLWEGPLYVGPGCNNPPDVFVADGLVWLGETRVPIDNSQTLARRQGFDPVTGKVVREVSVPKLLSPGHHYRCYRSKATDRFLLLGKRGVEFLDLQGKDHMRHDWLRAPCIYGVLPANGMLYAAPHPCVCYPGVLLSNFNALTAHTRQPRHAESTERLLRGPAWGKTAEASPVRDCDWPTYRHDPQRSGHVRTTLTGQPKPKWKTALTAPITPPVATGGRVLVAEKDTHQVVALDAARGSVLWQYTAGGRIDSAPTAHGELVLFGCADGWVYCLRGTDGSEIWRFRAAPRERRVLVCGQLESAWPVHGSVLVQTDTTADKPRTVAYVTAGRSSFLDGGIHVYGLNPHTGELLHHTCLDGPHPDPFSDTGMAGDMDGAKSDILVSDGADLYLFQERFTGNLTRIPTPMRNTKDDRRRAPGHRIYPASAERGASGRHLIATGGLLDDTYNEGTYWNYSNRWPGWSRLLSGVPGQLLVFDEHTLFGVNVFIDKVRVRRGFTPGGKGFRLFARRHGAGKDTWSTFLPVNMRAMVLAGKTLFVAGPPDVVPDDDPLAAFEGRKGSILLAVSATDGKVIHETRLDSVPVFDGLIAAEGSLIVSCKSGVVQCLGNHVPSER